MLSAEQKDSQSKEINVIDGSQAENKPVPLQEAERRWKKVSLVGHFRSKDSLRSPLTVPVRG